MSWIRTLAVRGDCRRRAHATLGAAIFRALPRRPARGTRPIRDAHVTHPATRPRPHLRPTRDQPATRPRPAHTSRPTATHPGAPSLLRRKRKRKPPIRTRAAARNAHRTEGDDPASISRTRAPCAPPCSSCNIAFSSRQQRASHAANAPLGLCMGRVTVYQSACFFGGASTSASLGVYI